MIADMAFPAAAIDIAHRTALDIGVGGGLELAQPHLEAVLHGTTGTTGIEVLIDGTAIESDIRGAADGGRGSQSASISIVAHVGTIMDMHIAVTGRAEGILLHQQGAVGSQFFGSIEAAE